MHQVKVKVKNIKQSMMNFIIEHFKINHWLIRILENRAFSSFIGSRNDFLAWTGRRYLRGSALKGRNEATKVEAATLIRVRGESHQLIKRTCIVVFLRDFRPAEYSKSASRLFRNLINCYADPLCLRILSLLQGILSLLNDVCSWKNISTQRKT